MSKRKEGDFWRSYFLTSWFVIYALEAYSYLLDTYYMPGNVLDAGTEW